MSFWSSQTITDRANNNKVIEPFYESRVKESAYSLSVGNEMYITSNSDAKFETRAKVKLDENKVYIIPPGQFAYILTAEVLKIPNNCLSFISMKFSIKAKGLINVSGFHVDPGYHGKLIFAVYNAGGQDVKIRKGDNIFLIWFANLDEEDKSCRNKPEDIKKDTQIYINPSDKIELDKIPTKFIDAAQNAETLKNISNKQKDLEKQVNVSTVRATLILSLLIPFNLWLIKYVTDKYHKKITSYISNTQNYYDIFTILAYFISIIIILELIFFIIKNSFSVKIIKFIWRLITTGFNHFRIWFKKHY